MSNIDAGAIPTIGERQTFGWVIFYKKNYYMLIE